MVNACANSPCASAIGDGVDVFEQEVGAVGSHGGR